MKEEVLKTFQEIATHLKIISPFQINLQEQNIQASTMSAENRSMYLLKDVIYQAFYAQDMATYLASLNATTITHDPAVKQQFIEQLSAQNHSANGWDMGWLVHSVNPNGQVYGQKQEQLRLLEPGKFRLVDSSQPLQPRSEVQILKEREIKDVQGAFYYVNGNALLAQTPHIVRLYWNITPEGAPLLIHLLTQHLNLYKVPFQFKCLNTPALYTRKDSAVLYIQKRHLKITLGLLEDIIHEMEPYLQTPPPLYTRVLYPGLSFAESPLVQTSFGMHRSQLVGEGLWNAYIAGKQSIEENVQSIIDIWHHHQVSLEQPYLNPMSQFPYSFTFEPTATYESKS